MTVQSLNIYHKTNFVRLSIHEISKRFATYNVVIIKVSSLDNSYYFLMLIAKMYKKKQNKFQKRLKVEVFRFHKRSAYKSKILDIILIKLVCINEIFD